MLLQSSAPSSIEADLSFPSKHGKQDSYEWMPAAETWQNYSKCDENPQDSSELLAASNIYAISGPNLMSKRRKLHRNSVVIVSAEAEANELPIFTAPAPQIIVRAPFISAEKCNRDLSGVNVPILNLTKPDDIRGSKGQCTRSFEVISNLHPASVKKEHRCDSLSSLEAEIGVGSFITKTEADDIMQFPSSDNFELDMLGEDLLVRDECISVLRSHGLLEGVRPMNSASTEVLRLCYDSSCAQSCKQCGHSGNALTMLICDHCEEAFHVSCCAPRINIMPLDEWFCHCCSKMNCKASLESTFLKSLCVSRGRGLSKSELGPIAFMLKYPELYTSRVRIGKAFQAEVPEWSGPICYNGDCMSEPLKIDDTAEIVSYM